MTGGKLKMQPAIKLRNIELGSGRPKLAVPITGTTINDILAATTRFWLHGHYR